MVSADAILEHLRGRANVIRERMDHSNSLPEPCTQGLAEVMRPDLFKALCDPVRISIVANLASGPAEQTVGGLTRCCGIDFSGVSRHLKILKLADIVEAKKVGREMQYSLKTEQLAETLREIADSLTACRAPE